MNQLSTPGARFRIAVKDEKPLQVIGAINAYAARLAESSGFRALYVSGGGVAASSLGIPDLGISTMDDVLTDVSRITNITQLPVLVDIDTGWGSASNIALSIKSMIKAGAAAVHIEDQVEAKRCGHRPGKAIVSKDEMVDRIKTAVDAKTDPDFVIMARTDALAVEGLEAAIDRARACVEAGADMIFPEAMTDLSMYKKFTKAVKVPVLANITEFGSTPLYTVEELGKADVSIVLYPLSAFRAMSKAALSVYNAIRRDGTQKNVIDIMQTREELYDYLDYHIFEKKIDKILSREDLDDYVDFSVFKQKLFKIFSREEEE
ncbi:MAG: methylisocitrate lyase [Nitrospirota bacterium]